MTSQLRFPVETLLQAVEELHLFLRFAIYKSWGEAVNFNWVAVISAKKHKRQRRKRQSVTAKREKSQKPKFITAIQTSPNLN